MAPRKKAFEVQDRTLENIDNSMISGDTSVANISMTEGASAKNKAKRAKRQLKKIQGDKSGVTESGVTRNNAGNPVPKANQLNDILPNPVEDEGNDSIISKPKARVQGNNASTTNNISKAELAKKRKRSSAAASTAVSTAAPVAKRPQPVDFPNNDTIKKTLPKPEAESALVIPVTDANQEFRYRRLVELRETKPEALLNDFKIGCQRRMEASDKLIQELSNQVATLSREGQNYDNLRQENANMREEKIQLVHQTESLLQQIELLRDQLADYDDEITILKAKLRSRSTNRDDYLANLKQQISSDLSGLVIEDVKVINGKRIFDCVQSGKNGIFHYELSIYVNEKDEESLEYTFTPSPDAVRDEYLMSILPGYFSDPLVFSKVSLGAFFWKITQSLNQKLQ